MLCLYANICRVYMEAVKLETLHGSTPVISNLQVAQDSLGSGTVISSCVGSHLLVRFMEKLNQYIILYQHVEQGERRSGSGASGLSGASSSQRSGSTEMGREARAALSLGFLMGAFLVCWLPFFIWMPLVTIMVRNVQYKLLKINLKDKNLLPVLIVIH